MAENNTLQQLISGCRRQDEASQLELYQRFYSYGMSICLRYARSRESALEMLNDGFLKVFLKIEYYDSSLPFRPWLRQVLVYAAIDHYRKYKREETDTLTMETDYEHPSTYNEALDMLEYDDLLRVMQELPTAYRMVFNLYIVDNLSHAEIAERLGINIGTSKSNLSKARQKIKHLLSQYQDVTIKIK